MSPGAPKTILAAGEKARNTQIAKDAGAKGEQRFDEVLRPRLPN